MGILKHMQSFLVMLWARINHDRLTTSAAELAYTTILALVPLITVIFALLSAFPMFDEVSQSLKQLIYSNLVPTASDTIQNYLEQFIANTKKMTLVGIIGLIVTSLLLINSINNALNRIWRTKRKRSFMYNLTMYWTILTLGPILVGSSVAVSSYIFSLKWLSDAASGDVLLSTLPFIISIVGFWLLYSIIPTESIPFKEAVIGALVAAILFEIGKRAFALYVTSFPTYQLIYGVVSSIPIMLVWIYCSWCIVLFGAEFAATLTDYNRHSKMPLKHSSQSE
ncbi:MULTISPECIES: virulence factor BrkB family protein [unclassified Gilliamella]|uniref:virulence factor BrkB family protein n=1 Tax=unclassified Gilliamella TaxID=2685620 RepID=UPI000B0C067F|nr:MULTISPECIES: virulence factor BrkB family protein [unclassified Gilliamella]MBI0038549.1 virulence factor BrkB family protein [Gilliamella sp. B14384G10]MBI0040812.1 virulence factor BrkB family protein [Gilliamella sp. B14384G7]MBI0052511.1 virulence factor BrkB family protein [Gilliamella sp. B14384G13]MBI0054806.1 virulence factor BrkB family protein [Gilliamella sp. B14384H2]MBI0104717.1 virulence factor BrkB family protein [Gilliamella sp. W8145]